MYRISQGSAAATPPIYQESALYKDVATLRANMVEKVAACRDNGFFLSGKLDRINLNDAIRQDAFLGRGEIAMEHATASGLPPESASHKHVQKVMKSGNGNQKLTDTLIQLYAVKSARAATGVFDASKVSDFATRVEDLFVEAEVLRLMPDVVQLATDAELHDEVIALASLIYALNHASSKLIIERLTSMP